jgi:hypothetical protein
MIEKGYLDKYSIAKSIDDGITVQLNYALALMIYWSIAKSGRKNSLTWPMRKV